MSEQYQRFKQNFLRQHPAAIQQNQQANEFQVFDPYGQSRGNNVRRQDSEEKLKIDNQNHFPFEDLENPTFNSLGQDPFLSYKQNGFNQQRYKKQLNLSYNANSNQLSENEFVNYAVNSEYPERAQSKYEYRASFKGPQMISKPSLKQQQQIDKINRELQKVRSKANQNFHASNPNQREQSKFQNMNNNKQIQFSPPDNQYQVRRFQHQKQQSRFQQKNSIRPQSYQSYNKVIGLESRRVNEIGLSPPKMLPVIYNTPNNLINSSHKISAQTYSPNNSRVIVQHQPIMQLPQVNQQHQMIQQGGHPIFNNTSQIVPNLNILPPHSAQQQQPNPNLINPHPNIIQSSQQKISSNSRVIVQSQPINKIIGSMPGTSSLNNINLIPSHHTSFESQNNISQGMVPLRDYENLKNECMMWQHRFHQANEQIQKIQIQGGQMGSNSHETMILREQNYRLMQKIRVLQNSDKNSHDKIKSSYEQLLRKYQDSLMKECNLLIDRFRLEMKHNERY